MRENEILRKWNPYVKGGHVKVLEIKELKDWNLLVVKGDIEDSKGTLMYWLCDSDGHVVEGDGINKST